MTAIGWMAAQILSPRAAEPEPAPKMKASAQSAVMAVLEECDLTSEARIARILGISEQAALRHLRALAAGDRAEFDGLYWRVKR